MGRGRPRNQIDRSRSLDDDREVNRLVTTKNSNISGFLHLIPDFTGSEDSIAVDQFIDNFEQVAQLGHWDDTEKLVILRLKLKGPAGQILAEDDEWRKTQNYTKFKKTLISNFSKLKDPITIRLQQFSSCCMTQDENIKQYATRLKILGTKFMEEDDKHSKLADKIKFSQFMKGILPKYKKKVWDHNPSSFEEAVKAAEYEELHDSLQINETEVNNVETQDINIARILDLQAEQTRELRNTLQKLTLEIKEIKDNQGNKQGFHRNQPRQTNNQQMKCYQCGRMGHLARNCFSNTGQNSNRGSNFFPRNANRITHNSLNSDKTYHTKRNRTAGNSARGDRNLN